jgi:hypothetical protein
MWKKTNLCVSRIHILKLTTLCEFDRESSISNGLFIV